MKKIISSFFAFICIFYLAACTGTAQQGDGKAGNTGNTSASGKGTESSAGYSLPSFPAGFVNYTETADNVTVVFDGNVIGKDFAGDFSVNISSGDWSITCRKVGDDSGERTFAVFKSYEEDGKRRSKAVKQADWKILDCRIIVSFNPGDIEGFDFFDEKGKRSVSVSTKADYSDNQTWQFEKQDITAAESGGTDMSLLLDDYGIGIKSTTFDLQYFKPATDDYIITNYDSADSEGNPTQTNALFSFDEKGNCVQYVARIEIPVDKAINGDISDIAGDSGYYRDYSSLLSYINANSNFGAKAQVLYALAHGNEIYTGGYYVESGLYEGAKMKVSKPLKGPLNLVNPYPSREDVHFDVVSQYFSTLTSAGDYIVSYSGPEVIDEYVEERTYMENGKTVFDNKKGDWATQEYRWPRISYERIQVWICDDAGKNTDYATFYVFEDKSMLAPFLYIFGILNYQWEHPENGALRYPEYRSDSPIDIVINSDYMDYLPDKYHEFGENILCAYDSIGYETSTKGQLLLDSMGAPVFWYSNPTITAKEAEALGICWETGVFDK